MNLFRNKYIYFIIVLGFTVMLYGSSNYRSSNIDIDKDIIEDNQIIYTYEIWVPKKDLNSLEMKKIKSSKELGVVELFKEFNNNTSIQKNMNLLGYKYIENIDEVNLTLKFDKYSILENLDDKEREIMTESIFKTYFSNYNTHRITITTGNDIHSIRSIEEKVYLKKNRI